MSKTKNSSALVVLSDPQICTSGANLEKLQHAAISQLTQIRQLESESALRALVVGFAFHRIKASVKHGEFMPWIKANVDSAGHRQANYYMRLAVAFTEVARVSKVEILAAPEDGSALTTADDVAKRFMAKAAKFVGAKSLNELLREHGIKDAAQLGGAREQTPAEIDAPADAEQLYLFARDEIGSAITRCEQLFLTENRLQHLAGHPEEIRGAVEGLRQLADKVEKAASHFLTK